MEQVLTNNASHLDRTSKSTKSTLRLLLNYFSKVYADSDFT